DVTPKPSLNRLPSLHRLGPCGRRPDGFTGDRPRLWSEPGARLESGAVHRGPWRSGGVCGHGAGERHGGVDERRDGHRHADAGRSLSGAVLFASGDPRRSLRERGLGLVRQRAAGPYLEDGRDAGRHRAAHRWRDAVDGVPPGGARRRAGLPVSAPRALRRPAVFPCLRRRARLRPLEHGRHGGRDAPVGAQQQDRRRVDRRSRGGKLFFVTGTANGTGANNVPSLWRTDGSAAGTLLLATFPSLPRALTAATQLFFTAPGRDCNGEELWVSDGTRLGTRPLTHFTPPSPFAPSAQFEPVLVAAGNHVDFAADDGGHGWEIWQSNGTVGGTRRITN